MSKERDELLRLVRHAEDPSAIDEERVLQALHGAIAAGESTAVSEQVEASLGAQTALPGSLTLSGIKLVGLALAVMSVAAVVALVRLPAAPAARLAAPDRSTVPPESMEVRGTQPAQKPAERSLGSEDASVPEAKGRRVEVRSRSIQPSENAAVPRRARATEEPEAAPDGFGIDGEQSTLQAELALLRRVQAALRNKDGVSALRELDAYPRRQGVLQAEREAARILSLCLLGRREEAQAAAAIFAVEYPESPQRATIDASCANSRRNDAP